MHGYDALEDTFLPTKRIQQLVYLLLLFWYRTISSSIESFEQALGFVGHLQDIQNELVVFKRATVPDVIKYHAHELVLQIIHGQRFFNGNRIYGQRFVLLEPADRHYCIAECNLAISSVFFYVVVPNIVPIRII